MVNQKMVYLCIGRFREKLQQQKGKNFEPVRVVKFFVPLLTAELAMDNDFTQVLFRLNSSDDDFNFILQTIKTRRNKNLKQDGYFVRVVSLYKDEDFRSLHF